MIQVVESETLCGVYSWRMKDVSSQRGIRLLLNFGCVSAKEPSEDFIMLYKYYRSLAKFLGGLCM